MGSSPSTCAAEATHCDHRNARIARHRHGETTADAMTTSQGDDPGCIRHVDASNSPRCEACTTTNLYHYPRCTARNHSTVVKHSDAAAHMQGDVSVAMPNLARLPEAPLRSHRRWYAFDSVRRIAPTSFKSERTLLRINLVQFATTRHAKHGR